MDCFLVNNIVCQAEKEAKYPAQSRSRHVLQLLEEKRPEEEEHGGLGAIGIVCCLGIIGAFSLLNQYMSGSSPDWLVKIDKIHLSAMASAMTSLLPLYRSHNQPINPL